MTRFGPFWPITIVVALIVGSLIAAVSWVMSTRTLVETYFGLFSVGILIDGRNHLANPFWRLAIEFGAKVAVM